LIFLKNGSVTMVVATSAVNFGLLFETEQISLIDSFAGLLNSLSFPIQIIIHSKRLDVSSYLNNLDQAYLKQTNPKLKQLITSYRQFVASVIKANNVLDKQFYVCLTVTPIELGVLPKNDAEKSKKANTVLIPRRDHLLGQLARLGLKTKQLTTVELVKLLYNIYNPPNSNLTVQAPAQPQARPIVAPTPAAAPPPPPLQPPPQTKPNLVRLGPTTTNLTAPFVVEELPDDFTATNY
ncbi:hypothetical protein HY385_01660, partial [Candidatus Daviesbacteria bacterium]|nr:hypothetical protein [Candidatus Daviesbacteria bacterium]